jgi:hypothetical protein
MEQGQGEQLLTDLGLDDFPVTIPEATRELVGRTHRFVMLSPAQKAVVAIAISLDTGVISVNLRQAFAALDDESSIHVAMAIARHLQVIRMH